jgi:DNA-binding response OmpR family regulator
VTVILLALWEDELELAYLFKEALSAKGYVVTVFTDPVVALESICTEHSRYRLVLSDVKMPKLDGIELVKGIHEKDSNIRLILMSAFDRIDIVSGLDHEFVRKPIHIGKLKEIVYRKQN